MSMPEQRRFIRHTMDVPIQVEEASAAASPERTVDLSVGGLSFESDHCPPIDRVIRLRIPTVEPPFVGEGRVVWCQRERTGRFVVGVQFLDAETAFRSRMVEQVCSIEKYRRDVEQQEGRILSSQEAAAEWVGKFAGRFPTS